MITLAKAATITGKSEYEIIQLITTHRISHINNGGVVLVDVQEIKKADTISAGFKINNHGAKV